MFRLDDDFLQQLGLGSLPVDEKNKMLAHIYETLEMRVGMRLAEQMTDDQLDEFEAFIDRNDENGALNWLETNFPNYKQVVAEELEKLKAEIRQVAPQVVAAANAAAQAQTHLPADGSAPQLAEPAPQPSQDYQSQLQPAPYQQSQPQHPQPQHHQSGQHHQQPGDQQQQWPPASQPQGSDQGPIYPTEQPRPPQQPMPPAPGM